MLSSIMMPEGYEDFSALLPMLLQAAEIEADPEVYANVLLDQMGAEKLLPIIGDKNRFVQGMQLLPDEFKPYFEWFEELRDMTVDIINQETQAGTDDVSEGHDGGEDGEVIPDADDDPDISPE